jgi:hypothetical protein
MLAELYRTAAAKPSGAPPRPRPKPAVTPPPPPLPVAEVVIIRGNQKTVERVAIGSPE